MTGRTARLLAPSALLPIGGALLLVVAEGMGLNLGPWRTQAWSGWLAIGALVAIGAACLFYLDWPLGRRLLIIAVYAPIMVVVLVSVLLTAACSILGECL